MNTSERLWFALRYPLITLLLLSAPLTMAAQVGTPDRVLNVKIALKPDKETIMLGEPMFVSFVMTNLSDWAY